MQEFVDTLQLDNHIILPESLDVGQSLAKRCIYRLYIYISTGYIYIFNTVLTVIFSHIEPHKIKILSEKCEHNYAIIFI